MKKEHKRCEKQKSKLCCDYLFTTYSMYLYYIRMVNILLTSTFLSIIMK